MLITFEGLPGAGKTTQATLLAECLTQQRRQVAMISDLASLDTQPLTRHLVELLAASDDPYLRSGDAITDAFLTAAIRSDLVATILDPALTNTPETIVLEDRGIHTMQSYALANLLHTNRAPLADALAWIRALTTLAGPRATTAIWLRVPVAETLRRTRHRDHRSPLPEQRSYLRHVDRAYHELAHRDPELTPIDADETNPALLHRRIHQHLSQHRTICACAPCPDPDASTRQPRPPANPHQRRPGAPAHHDRHRF